MTGHQQPSAKYWKGCWLFWNTSCFSSWWCQIFSYFHPYLAKIPILTHIFQRGWNHQPVFLATGKEWKQRNNLGPAIKNSSAQQDVMIQSIPNFVQESAVGNTQRVKNAVDFFLWLILWMVQKSAITTERMHCTKAVNHRINYQPQLVSHRRILNEPSTVCQQFRIRVKVGSLHVVFTRNKTHRTVVTSPNVTASG